MGRNPAFLQQTLQGTTGIILAHHRNQRRLRAQRRRIAGHVGGATRALFQPFNLDHRHRRFRRDAADIAKPVAVEHHIANDEQAHLRNFFQHHVHKF